VQGSGCVSLSALLASLMHSAIPKEMLARLSERRNAGSSKCARESTDACMISPACPPECLNAYVRARKMHVRSWDAVVLVAAVAAAAAAAAAAAEIAWYRLHVVCAHADGWMRCLLSSSS